MDHTLPISLLAAVDYSELSPLVVSQAISLASHYGSAEAHFLHVSDDAPKHLGSGARRSEKLLSWLSDQLKDLGAVPETVRIVGHEANGDAANVILQTAGDLLADLVLVGSHGRTGMDRLLTESVAELVTRHAACPVLVVRPKTHEDPAAQIEPPCPQCVQARIDTRGAALWCEQHQERHGRRHTYYDQQGQRWGGARLVS
jgi:nucleotide-binding universal stress UspA family protein